MKVRFGIVGTNRISDWVIAGGLQDERFEPVAVCSRTRERAEAFAARHGIAHTFTSLEAMASSPLIDAVYIATPNSCHAQQSILCMSHGKHVLCEKPFAANAHEARQMIDTARRYGVTLMEAMVTTLNPNFAIVQSHLHELGTLRRYVASYCQYSSRYDNFKQGIIVNAFRPELANGAVMDIGVYTIYPMIALFGRPKQVEAQSLMLHTGVDGQGTVNCIYEGMHATLLYSKIANSHLPTEIEGEEGCLLLDEIHIPKAVRLIPRQTTAQGHAVARDIGIVPTRSEYYYEVAEFINLIEQHRQESAINRWDTSLATMEVIDEIRRVGRNV